MIVPYWLAVPCPVCRVLIGRRCPHDRERIVVFTAVIDFNRQIAHQQVERARSIDVTSIEINLTPILDFIVNGQPAEASRRREIVDTRIWRV